METCQTSNCINNPIAICLHCQQKLCVEHLLQHNEEMINKANKYCDEFNELTEQIEKLSFDEQFQSAQEDLYDWVNDQMKQLDKIYEQKLFELKQTHCDTNKQLKIFKQIQQTKLNDIQHRLFNSQLSKQISLEQLNRMNLAIEQLREDIHQFKTNQCSITLVNNDQMNYSYIPNIDIQFKKKIADENKTIIEVEPKCDKIKTSQLSVHAKPFEYIPKDQNYSSYSSNRQNNLTNRLFDEYNLMKSINQMSHSKISLDEIVRFTSRTAGRDKVYRTVQYASRFLAWYYINKRHAGSTIQRIELFQNLETVMSLTRKGMRLGRFMDYIKSVLESFHIRNKRIGTLFGLIAVCQGLFMLLDNLLLFHRFKIIHLTNPQRLQHYLYQVWLLWISFALTRDYYEMQASFAIGQHHHYQQKQDKSLLKRVNIFWANKPLVIDTIKNLCDLYIPLSNLNIVHANPGLQGFVGTISSILGLLQLWDKSYQLPA
ncbi:unnamed protein product [Adineta steineri]|uniref:Peroxisomal biogenesis factor 11 n=1 Tax=Adineta steineri TaxID=433720 RepID=A0A813Z2H3_9BILA|nr:unnamed protein product [Adineta steineri]CAF0892759.1 unnamed protein product [Adineta steineri]